MSISIFSLLSATMLSRALFVATEYDIAEHLQSQSMTAAHLAVVTGLDPKSLARLLYFLELHEVFSKDSEGRYTLTDFSKTMCGNHPQTVKPLLLHDDETRWNALGNLSYSIKTGKASYDMLYGQSFFEYQVTHSHLGARFDEAMLVISRHEDAQIAQALTFTGVVADIGGGKGQLLENIVARQPAVTPILFDLPEVVANAEQFAHQKIGGSFFEPLKIDADIFILKRILHDWDDEKAVLILQQVSAAMQSNSRLFIIDGLLDQAQDKQTLAAIDLALLAIFQGKERALPELEKLLNAANLQVIKVHAINELLSAVEVKRK